MWLGFIICGAVAALMLVMALFLLNGKGAFMIAGYNTMSKGEKAKYDEKALCRFAGWLLIMCSVCIMLIPLGAHFGFAWLSYGGIAILLIGSVGAVIYVNASKRFRGDDSKAPFRPKAVMAAVILSAVVLIGVGVLLYQGAKEPNVLVHGDVIQIKGMYGLDIDLSEIAGISLVEKSMRDIGAGSLRRTNGFSGIGDALKGHFRSESLGGAILLFVQSGTSPTIHIQRADKKDIYISFRDGEAARELYHEMRAAVPAA